MPRTRKPKAPWIDLVFQFADDAPITCRVPLNASAHEMTSAAAGKLLPPGARPSRLMRGGQQIAFYDPYAPLHRAKAQTGDVLLCELDCGQEISEPSFLAAYRAMSAFAVQAAARAHEYGHLPIGKSAVTH
jgi:hypothetical protein